MRDHSRVGVVLLAVAASLIFLPRMVEGKEKTCQIEGGDRVPIQKWVAGGQSSGTPWPNGFVVNAINESLPARVLPECNPATYATGLIWPVDTGCTETHFHGTLAGQSDPAPSTCGQFKVIPFDEDTYLTSVAHGISSSHTARRLWTDRDDDTPCTAAPFTTFLNPCWPGGAGREINRAANELARRLRTLDEGCASCPSTLRDLLKDKTRQAIEGFKEAAAFERRGDRAGACAAYNSTQDLLPLMIGLGFSCGCEGVSSDD